MEHMSRFLDAVEKTVHVLPHSALDVFKNVIIATSTNDWKSFERAVLQSLPLPGQRQQVSELLHQWHDSAPTSTTSTVALMLATAEHCLRACPQVETTELVWTGPEAGDALRRTDQALLQVIQSAKRDLLIVTFAAYKMPTIANALLDAVNRGVHFWFIAESADGTDGKAGFNPFAALGSELASRAQVYVWPLRNRIPDSAGRHGSLHTKCAVADSRLLFVSSANLTEYAHNINMEMGILVHDEILARQATEHFAILIRNKTLLPVGC